MGLEFAIDELYSSGWQGIEPKGCDQDASGRFFPTGPRVCDEFFRAGYSLTVRHIQLFGCYRAEWHDETGLASGAVVGSTEQEAAVYALALLRRNLQTASVH